MTLQPSPFVSIFLNNVYYVINDCRIITPTQTNNFFICVANVTSLQIYLGSALPSSHISLSTMRCFCQPSPKWERRKLSFYFDYFNAENWTTLITLMPKTPKMKKVTPLLDCTGCVDAVSPPRSVYYIRKSLSNGQVVNLSNTYNNEPARDKVTQMPPIHRLSQPIIFQRSWHVKTKFHAKTRSSTNYLELSLQETNATVCFTRKNVLVLSFRRLAPVPKPRSSPTSLVKAIKKGTCNIDGGTVSTCLRINNGIKYKLAPCPFLAYICSAHWCELVVPRKEDGKTG